MMRQFQSLIVICLSILLGATLALAQDHQATDHAHGHPFDDAAKWSATFDDPERDQWQKPEPSDVVADIGAGTGYLSVRLAHHLGTGTVYAVDAEKGMVHHLGERANAAGIGNLRPILGDASSANLPEKVDLAVLLDVYHHVSDRSDYFRRLAGSLKPGGRVAIIDFRPESPVGAPKEMRVSPEQIQAEMSAAGYRLADKYDFLPYQNFLIFETSN